MDQTTEVKDALIHAVLTEFCPRFTPGGRILWVMEGNAKPISQLRADLARCGTQSLSQDDLPNVGIHHLEKGWLVLVNATSVRGSMTSDRRKAIAQMFHFCQVGLVFVAAFRSRRDFQDSFTMPAWKTTVWVAQEPDHLIHFDGERFLGPYPDVSPSSS